MAAESPVPVLVLVPALPVGGAERQIAALVRGLDPLRFRAIVACQHAEGPVADEIRAAGIPVHLLSDGARADPDFLRRLLRLVRRERPGVLLSHGFSTGVANRVAGVLGRVPVRILAEHSTGERDMSATRHRVNRLLNRFTTAWISVAHGQRDYLLGTKGIPSARLHVIHNGIDPARYGPTAARARIRAEWDLPAEAPVAGVLAVLRPEKNLRSFLLAARFVADELPQARFVIVGDGPERELLEREVHALNLEKHVRMPGRRDDVPEVLTAFDASVLCSTDVETFPMAFLEAMATGLPLVATNVGGLPEMITEEENGLLVRPRDPRGLADAMLRLLSDADLRARWGAASRARVENEFHVHTMVRAYEDLFETQLGERGIHVPPRVG